MSAVITFNVNESERLLVHVKVNGTDGEPTPPSCGSQSCMNHRAAGVGKKDYWKHNAKHSPYIPRYHILMAPPALHNIARRCHVEVE